MLQPRGGGLAIGLTAGSNPGGTISFLKMNPVDGLSYVFFLCVKGDRVSIYLSIHLLRNTPI